uniref:Uncharacterized protein n=1 Tax=Panagrolaimus davidi TaxID=227884 RepID=A0A914QC53_9BILA
MSESGSGDGVTNFGRRRKLVLTAEDTTSCGTAKRQLVVEEVCETTDGSAVQHRIRFNGQAKTVIGVLLPAHDLQPHDVLISASRADNVVGISYCGNNSAVVDDKKAESPRSRAYFDADNDADCSPAAQDIHAASVRANCSFAHDIPAVAATVLSYVAETAKERKVLIARRRLENRSRTL